MVAFLHSWVFKKFGLICDKYNEPFYYHSEIYSSVSETLKWIFSLWILHGSFYLWDCEQRTNKLHWDAVVDTYKAQFSSVAQLCLTLCDPTDCSMPGFCVYHELLEATQTYVHPLGDTIQPSHPLSSPSPPVFSLSQHQGFFKWVSSSHQVAKVLDFSF